MSARPGPPRRSLAPQDTLRIVFAASECLPFVKTGGLADVTASLPKELAELGHQVDIFIPLYLKALLYPIDHGVPIEPNHEFPEIRFRIDDYSFRSRIYSTQMPDANVRVHLVDSDTYEHFTARGAHASPYHWSDNFGRFAFFSRVVAGVSAARAERPHVVHAHDWHTGLVPTFLSTEHARAGIASVFTIHNMGYTHAATPPEFYRVTGLTEAHHPGLYDWKNHGILHHERMDMLKAGIVRADMVSTVSPTYAQEIQDPELGGAYAATMRWVAGQGRLRGILNGLDPLWSPALPVNEFLDHKLEQKRQIQEIFNLPPDDDAMVCVMTSRLAHQKGFQLLPDALGELRRRRVRIQLVAAVDGEPALRDLFVALDHKDLPVRHRPYNESLTRTVIYPGADALLMPSLYEPCGLSQLIAQKNGTIPIVHATGGLRDTVRDGETGFAFERFGPGELAHAVERAHRCFRHETARWGAMVRQVMALDSGWGRSAEAYVELYREAIGRHHAVHGLPAPRPVPGHAAHHAAAPVAGREHASRRPEHGPDGAPSRGRGEGRPRVGRRTQRGLRTSTPPNA